MRIKEQETRLTLHEHEHDDDDDDGGGGGGGGGGVTENLVFHSAWSMDTAAFYKVMPFRLTKPVIFSAELAVFIIGEGENGSNLIL